METTPVQAEDILSSGLHCIARRIDARATGISALRRLSGGANQETWSFNLERADGTAPMILRRCPPQTARPAGTGTASFTGMATEAALLDRAARAGVPVPVVRAQLAPADGIGDGFIMNFVAGETLGGRIVRDPSLAHARTVLAYQCGRALAAIHSIAHADLPPLREAAAAEEVANYLARHRAGESAKPVFELAFQWLQRNLPPAPERKVLVHGDFRNGNLMVGEDGLRAVLDWELAHLGDPMEDLGWLCVNSWRFGHTSLPVGGFGTREDLFAGYEAGGGTVDAARVHFWEVFGSLKWGIGCESMAQAPAGGAPRTVERAAIGRRSSETEIDLLNLLAPRRGAR